MIKKIFLLSTVFFQVFCFSQNWTGEELINKSIKYHDPNNNWETFSGELNITTETPTKAPRVSSIFIDIPKEYFKNEYRMDSNIIKQEIRNDSCKVSFNGSFDFSEEEENKYRLSCYQTKRTRDYYTYLYGLPMKLKDQGTIVESKTEKRTFKGKGYLVVQVSYEKEVGKDIWYFYLDPVSYALEVYQFFHDESKNDGEYILLTKELLVNGIKMPKNRAWYYNEKDKYLGTDFLFKTNPNKL
tara:strand:+ start:760 stop:1485 length:726 start_codon:yes stop_codon:yes gene_type:complete